MIALPLACRVIDPALSNCPIGLWLTHQQHPFAGYNTISQGNNVRIYSHYAYDVVCVRGFTPQAYNTHVNICVDNKNATAYREDRMMVFAIYTHISRYTTTERTLCFRVIIRIYGAGGGLIFYKLVLMVFQLNRQLIYCVGLCP